MTTYRLFQWTADGNLEAMGQYEDKENEITIGAEIRLEWDDNGVDQEQNVKVLEILEPNPRRIPRTDGAIYEPEPIAIVEGV